MIRSFFILLLCLSTLEATKRFARVTGLKCLACHTSRKGGNKSLREKGKEYEIFHTIKNNLRRSRLLPTEQNLQNLLKGDENQWLIWTHWFDLEKKLRRSRIRPKKKRDN